MPTDIGSFEIQKTDVAIEREIHLIAVKNVKQDHFVAAKSNVTQSFQHVIRIVEAIRNDEYEAATNHAIRELFEKFDHSRLLGRVGLFERFANRHHVTHLRTCRQLGSPLGIENPQGNRVPLLDDGEGNRGSEQFGVLQFVLFTFTVPHRVAGIDEKVSDVIRFLFVLLDRISLVAAVSFPVDVFDVVAGNVFASLHELDGETAKRTFMIADAETLNDLTRGNPQRFCASKNIWLK